MYVKCETVGGGACAKSEGVGYECNIDLALRTIKMSMNKVEISLSQSWFLFTGSV